MAQRIGALRPQLALELYERDPVRETLQRRDPRAAGNIDSWIVPQRETQALLDQACAALDPIAALAPRAISLHPSVASKEVWLRFRGLAIARWDESRVFFGTGERRKELSAASRPALKKLLHDLETYRHPLASDTRHALYRAQPERWLEAIVREDVTRSGRLAILELKATEHIHLALQAAGYWRHVRHHLEHENLSRYGYFPGVPLQAAPPLVLPRCARPALSSRHG